jgi:hypothetical protein
VAIAHRCLHLDLTRRHCKNLPCVKRRGFKAAAREGF